MLRPYFPTLITGLAVILILAVGCSGGEGPIPPMATDQMLAVFNHTAPNGCAPGETVVFDASGSRGGLVMIDTYSWDWDDGSGPETYEVASAAHTFSGVGIYMVRLTVRNVVGSSVSTSQPIVIMVPGTAPSASFSYEAPDGWQPGSEFIFDASDSTDPDGDEVTYFWDWGDGQSSGPLDSPTVSHVFDVEGEVIVTLTVSDPSGRESVSEPLTIPLGYPLNPEVISSTEALGGGDVELIGDYAYMLVPDHGLQIVDISDPEYPKVISQAFTTGRGWEIAVSGDYAYVAEAHQDFGSTIGFLVFDVSNPAQPHLAASHQVGDALCVTLSESHAYVSGRYPFPGSLMVYDIQDPANPVISGTDDSFEGGASIAVLGNHAFIGYYDTYGRQDFGYIFVCDVSDPTSPVGVGSYEATGEPHDLGVSGEHLYALLGDPNPGTLFVVYDVSNPSSIDPIGSVSMADSTYDMQVIGDYAYVADRSDDLTIIDLTDPTAPAIVARVQVHKRAWTVGIYGNTAFVFSVGSNGNDPTYSVIRLW